MSSTGTKSPDLASLPSLIVFPIGSLSGDHMQSWIYAPVKFVHINFFVTCFCKSNTPSDP